MGRPMRFSTWWWVALLPRACGEGVAVVQWATPDYERTWRSFFARNRAYAERHKHYAHVVVRDSFEEALGGLPRHWGKVLALQQVVARLQAQPDGPAWVLWLDADCVVANLSQPLDPFYQLDADLPRVVEVGSRAEAASVPPGAARDPAWAWHLVTTDANIDNQFHVNNAALLLRVSSWTAGFLELWWGQAHRASWFAHDQGAFWNALLLHEFPRAFDDSCVRSAVAANAGQLAACVGGWLQRHAGVGLGDRRTQNVLLIDPLRHLRPRPAPAAHAHVRGLHFWSSLTVALQSPLFHPCSFHDHFEDGDFIVQTKNPHELHCGPTCFAGVTAWALSGSRTCQAEGVPALVQQRAERTGAATYLQHALAPRVRPWQLAAHDVEGDAAVVFAVQVLRPFACRVDNATTVEPQGVERQTVLIRVHPHQHQELQLQGLVDALCGFRWTALGLEPPNDHETSQLLFERCEASILHSIQHFAVGGASASRHGPVVVLMEHFDPAAQARPVPPPPHTGAADFVRFATHVFGQTRKCGLQLQVTLRFPATSTNPNPGNGVAIWDLNAAAGAFGRRYGVSSTDVHQLFLAEVRKRQHASVPHQHFGRLASWSTDLDGTGTRMGG